MTSTNGTPQTNGEFSVLGKGRKIIDGLEKVTGAAKYSADLVFPGMLYARPVLSPYAHAKILSIDTSEAAQVPGVVAVLTAEDLPTKDRVIASRNSAVLAKEKVLFRGQPVVVVVAENEDAAQDGAELVFVDYEPLEPVIDLSYAITKDAPTIWPDGLPKDEVDLTAAHAAVEKKEVVEDADKPNNVHKENHNSRGDVEKGFAEADVVIERTYTTTTVHQTYLEPHGVVADFNPFKQTLDIYTATQGQFGVRDEVARLMGLPKSKVTVKPQVIGGGFGAKYGIVEPLAGAVSMTVGKPVKMVFSRSEDFLSTTPSPGTIIELKTGAKKDGTITAIQATVYLDNGIFAFAIGGIVTMLMGGYYRCENVKIDCYEVNTNKPQAGAYRAPGAPQATFAIEANIEDMARELGLDPLDFRIQNASEDGDLAGNGSPWPSFGLKKCLEELKAHPAWQNRHQKGKNEGIGISVGAWPAGVGPAASVCRIDSDGTVRVHIGTVDISGVNSSLALVAAEVLGVSPDDVEIIQGDTKDGPYGPPSGGSQVTYSTSGAVANAAREVRTKLLELAADEFEASVDDLEIRDGKVQVKGVPDRVMTVAELADKANRKRPGPGPLIGEGTAAIEKNSPGTVAHLVRVQVDPETGRVKPVEYVAVQDVGFALNPMLVEGQIHGGVAQGIGWGLHEGMIYDNDGQLLTANFMDYGIPKFGDVPNIEAVMVNNPSPIGPFGARGIGEPPITAGAAAIGNAIKDALGVRVEKLPIRSEDVWQAVQAAK